MPVERHRLYREVVLAAAEREFARVGFSAAKMAAIARAADVSLATVYKTFPGKTEIWDELHAERMSALLALVKAGRVESFRGYREWTATSFRVDADEPVAAGVDGEAMTLSAPLLFEAHPGAVRVRVPRHASGLSPGALAEIPLARRFAALARVAAGRPV